jgi:MerR family transcriptional regulator, mercuric resistance operon regulatory protein
MISTSPQQPAALSIGELSRRTRVNIETIRYYERINMLPAPPRTASGRRVYGPADRRTLAFIRRARELGFTLNEIRALLALSGGAAREACAEVRELAASHLAEIRAKIADLRAMERALADAVRRCDAGEAPGCPVLDALSEARRPFAGA